MTLLLILLWLLRGDYAKVKDLSGRAIFNFIHNVLHVSQKCCVSMLTHK